MARRSPAPFDVMRDVRSGPSGDGGEAGSGLPEPTWGSLAHRAVTVRIPPGFVFMGVAGLLAMLVVVYLAGRKHGYSEGFAVGKEEAQRIAALTQRHPAPAVPGSHGTPAASPLPVAPPTHDTRVEGLNYFVLARELEPQARRLVAFLASRGVEAIAIPINNSSLYHVVDLRGFAPEAIESEAYTRHVRYLAQLGREWKDQHDGPTDFGTMWLKKYQP